ncbi:MAG: hypothetical protein WCA84_18170 [Ignavibacteriaceae bacterium]|jgi:hypothetical protein
MAGKIKKQIDEIIIAVAKDNQTIRNITKTKLVLKGINPDRFNDQSPDDQVILEKLKLIAIEFGIK